MPLLPLTQKRGDLIVDYVKVEARSGEDVVEPVIEE